MIGRVVHAEINDKKETLSNEQRSRCQVPILGANIHEQAKIEEYVNAAAQAAAQAAIDQVSASKMQVHHKEFSLGRSSFHRK